MIGGDGAGSVDFGANFRPLIQRHHVRLSFRPFPWLRSSMLLRLCFPDPYEDLYSVHSHCRLERRFLDQFVMISVLNGPTGKISFTRSRFECKPIETPGLFALGDFVASPSDWV